MNRTHRNTRLCKNAHLKYIPQGRVALWPQPLSWSSADLYLMKSYYDGHLPEETPYLLKSPNLALSCSHNINIHQSHNKPQITHRHTYVQWCNHTANTISSYSQSWILRLTLYISLCVSIKCLQGAPGCAWVQEMSYREQCRHLSYMSLFSAWHSTLSDKQKNRLTRSISSETETHRKCKQCRRGSSRGKQLNGCSKKVIYVVDCYKTPFSDVWHGRLNGEMSIPEC